MYTIIKPVGSRCNLSCGGCYYGGNPFDGETGAVMSEDTLEETIRQSVGLPPPGRPAVFIWHGGEPALAGLDFFRRAATLQDRYLPEGRALNIMQTNGLLLDEEWCSFLADRGFLVGLSINGDRDIHDAVRKSAGGEPTHERVMTVLRRLRRRRVEINLLCCVHGESSGRGLEIYRFLRGTGAIHIQFIPAVSPRVAGMDRIGPARLEPDGWGEFLVSVFREWIVRDIGKISIREFDALLKGWRGDGSPTCVFSEGCGDAVVVERNGDVFCCDHFVDRSHRLGNLHQVTLSSLVGSALFRDFTRQKLASLPDTCRECEYLPLCHGGCVRNRTEGGATRFCEGYRRFFSYARPFLEEMESSIRGNFSPDLVRSFAAERIGTEPF